MTTKAMPHPRHGSTLDDFLQTEGVLEEFQATAIKEVIAWQLAKAMETEGITKVEMAKRMKTSRWQLDRVLDPSHDGVSLGTLNRAALALGRKVRLELV